MAEHHLLRCTVTHYRVDYGPDPHPLGGELRETVREETTGYHVRDALSGDPDKRVPYLYLHNSSASAPLVNLLAAAHEGQGWPAQAGTPPVFVDGEGWGGRNWPRIYVGADALLELEEALR